MLKQVVILSLVLASSLLASLSAQAFLKPKSQQLQCRDVSGIMGRYLDNHITHSKVDRKIEIRTAKKLIENMDPSKLYFIEKDVKQIEGLLRGVFTKIKKSDCKVLQQVYSIYIKRLEQRSQFAKAYMRSRNFKLNKKLSIVVDPKKRTWPKSTQQADANHRKFLQYQVATRLVDEKDGVSKAKSLVERHYNRTLRWAREKATQPKLLERYLDAFSLALDPHSSYFSKDDLDDFKIQMSLSLDGIGATLGQEDGYTVIHQLLPGGAAARSMKLQPEDKIVAVAQGNGAFENVIEQSLREVVKKIRGRRGTQVRLKILRKKDKKTTKFEVSLRRRKIELQDMRAAIHYFDYKRGGRNVKVALIDVPAFYTGDTGSSFRRGQKDSVTDDVKKLLAQARFKKVHSVVLDLSNNGGGSLEDAVNVTGLFLKKGSVVKQSSRDSKDGLALRDDNASLDWRGPLVVLTSPGSASASEIVAGALQDYKRAVVVGGQSTFGKGSVQSVETLRRSLGAIKTTVGLFFIPGGHSTQQVGVRSDVVLPSIYEAMDYYKSEKQLDHALMARQVSPFLSTKEVNEKAQKGGVHLGGVRPWKPVSLSALRHLKKRSALRVSKSQKFKEIRDDIKEALQKKNKHLNLGELLEKDNEDKEDKKDSKKVAQKKDKNKGPQTPEQITQERIKKYKKRADVLEALDVAADLYTYQRARLAKR